MRARPGGPRQRMPWAAGLLAVTLCHGPAAPASAAGACAPPEVSFAITGVSDSAADRFRAQLAAAIARVCAWWGPGYTGSFSVVVEDYAGPSMALVPAWRGTRGQMRFSAPTVARGRAAAVHEVTHVFAPNANRFLAEGLAVHAHDRLGGATAYPNFGTDLHGEARAASRVADIAALDRVATPARLQVAGLDERQAYIVAGSFVRFVIDEFGMERFRALYALTPLVAGQRDAGGAGRWQEVYALSLDALAQRWRERVARD